jgi:hypothetical protein
MAKAQFIEEAVRCNHRAHRVRTRWADADFEDVENRKEHGQATHDVQPAHIIAGSVGKFHYIGICSAGQSVPALHTQ